MQYFFKKFAHEYILQIKYLFCNFLLGILYIFFLILILIFLIKSHQDFLFMFFFFVIFQLKLVFKIMISFFYLKTI